MSTDLPRLPLGISEFALLREVGANYLYVDKTRPLADLLASGKYIFLARPRRFGKSLLCSTMRCLYEGRRDLFTGLAIEPEWDWSRTNPVVHLSLTDVATRTVEQLEQSLLRVLGERAANIGLSLDAPTPTDALPMLIRGLHALTGRRVVVIVDEYEKPVHDHLDDPAQARRMRSLLASFYGALKGCDGDLEMVFITGIGRMVKTSIFSELNQMRDLTLLPTAAEVCGYTEEELRRTFAGYIARLAESNALSADDALARLRERYNGYWWGHGERVYNPWAILNCMADSRFGNTWWASGTPGMLATLAETMQRPDGDLEGVEASDLSLMFDIAQPDVQEGAESASGGLGAPVAFLSNRRDKPAARGQRSGTPGAAKHGA